MTKCYSMVAAVPVLFLILVFPVLSADFKAIKDPKPNIIETEKHYVQLEKVKTIDADLGNEMYLFRPFSITVSKDSDDVYIYDNLQAKIFIMDSELKTVKRSFGGKGDGPGELGGTGKRNLVFIQMGRDGRLCAYSLMMRKVLIYDQNGKFIRDIKNIDEGNWKPLADASGNLCILNVKDKMIDGLNEKKVTLFTITRKDEYFDFLLSRPDSLHLKMLSMDMDEAIMSALTVKSRLLVYFPSSATMMVVDKNKISKQFRLWPKEALALYQKNLTDFKRKSQITKKEKARKKQTEPYLPLFSNLFVDESDDNVFYLELAVIEKSGTHRLYQFNDNGQLLKVFHVKPEDTPGEEPPFIHFKAKKNDRFYTIEEDRVILYRDVSK
jgi:hypothetical protein